MAATAVHAGPKGSKKKAAAPVERADSPAPSAGSGPAADNQDETPYIKELHKNIRNLSKKITNASKTDSVLKEHKGKNLDDLVSSKIINADQKAQILKKPGLQAQLAQAEEQLAQYQQVHEHYRAKAVGEKSEWEKSLGQVKADAVKEVKEEFEKSLHNNMLVLSQFLRLAAYRREENNDPQSDESQAIEGVLLAIYAGDESAVSAMLKLVNGDKDQVLSVPGEPLQTTYSSIKTLAQEYKAPVYTEAAAEEPVAEPVEPAVAAESVQIPAHAQQDAGLNGVDTPIPVVEALDNSPEADNGLMASQEWVDVQMPREVSEVGSGLSAAPAPALAPAPAPVPVMEKSTRSWADDQPEPTKQASAASIDSNDGFHQVQRNRGRQDREGGAGRGRGRGEHRGRGGQRGDGRGRGRGRGGIATRGGRRNDEA